MAQYVVGLDSSLKRIFVWKTTGDPTVLTNWSAQDRGLFIGYTVPTISAVLNGTDIEVALVYVGAAGTAGGAGTGLVKYAQFDTTTDTWSVGHELVDNTTTGVNAAALPYMSCSIAARTSDVVILHTDGYETINTDVVYSRGASGSWTSAVAVKGSVNTFKSASMAVKGASDRIHFFYADDDNDDILHRSLSSGNVLDTEATVDAAAIAGVKHPIGRGIAYPDNGNTTIKVPYLDADESITSIRIDASGANPTIATDTAASDNDAEDINSSVVACMAVDGTDTWLLYSGGGVSGVDQDLYTDTQEDGGSWGTDTEEQDAITMNRLSAGKYTRSATDYIGYVWLDGTTTSYDEITLAAPPAPIPDRLYAVEQAINRSSTY
jgi:hypothetical protein